MDYAEAWALQQRLVQARQEDRCPDTFLLVEHEPAYTAGRRSQPVHWRGDRDSTGIGGTPLYHVDRGGSVTYHGPGQLVGYPILRLQRFCPGPKVYVRMLEEAVIRTIGAWGLDGFRLQGLPGVWVRREHPVKIAAVGVRVVRGVSMHGFALNVAPDLTAFDRIVPCGIEGVSVTSMAAELGADIGLPEVRRRLTAAFADLFGLEWIVSDPAGGPCDPGAEGEIGERTRD